MSDRENLLAALKEIEAQLAEPSPTFAKFHNQWSEDVASVGPLNGAQSLRLLDKGDLVAIGRGVLRGSSGNWSDNVSTEWQGGFVNGTYYGPDDPPPKHDDTIRFISGSLHTLKGKPTLKMTCAGEKCYNPNDVVSEQDFDMGGCDDRFLGRIVDVRVAIHTPSANQPPEVRQEITIEITKHSAIESGEYKPKKVLPMAQSAKATNDAVAQAIAAANAAEIAKYGGTSAALKPDHEYRRTLLCKIAQHEKSSLVEAVRKHGERTTESLKNYIVLMAGPGAVPQEFAPDPPGWMAGLLDKKSTAEITPMPKPGERKFSFDDE